MAEPNPTSTTASTGAGVNEPIAEPTLTSDKNPAVAGASEPVAEPLAEKGTGAGISVGTKRFHCTTCPSECALTVEVAEDAPGALRVISVQGNRCPRGKIFAEQEITCPMRILATTVVVKNGDERLLPVRTDNAIPRALHMQAMELVRHASIEAPIHMGDVIMNDVLGTGVDLIASMDVARVART